MNDNRDAWPPAPNLTSPTSDGRIVQLWLAPASIAFGVCSLLFIVIGLCIEGWQPPLKLTMEVLLGGLYIVLPSARTAFIFFTVGTLVMPFLGLGLGLRSRKSSTGKFGMWLSIMLMLGSICYYLLVISSLAHVFGVLH